MNLNDCIERVNEFLGTDIITKENYKEYFKYSVDLTIEDLSKIAKNIINN